MHKITVGIVDDHLLIARAIGGIIDKFSGFEVVLEAENGLQLQQRLAAAGKQPDIMLMDISMPVMDGFETTAWLTKQYPAIKVMALSMQDDDESVMRMVRAGARGYLLKNTSPAELENALRMMEQNGMYFPGWASAKVFKALQSKEAAPSILISAKELEFLKWAATELTYKEIGEKMFCSPRTVESYRDSLFEKTGLKTRVGLVVYAAKESLIML